MNTIIGKIALANTGAGIPNLLVVIYDVDPETRLEEAMAELAGAPLANEVQNTAAKAFSNARAAGFKPGNSEGFIGGRIGSVLTGQDGSFLLAYEDAAFQARDSRKVRPDLFLMVLAPEQAGKALMGTLLYYSPEIRQNAGKTETYYIQISGEQLKNANLPTTIQSPENDSRTVVDSIRHNRRYAKEVAADIVKEERQKQKELDGIIQNKVLPSFFRLAEAPKNVPPAQSDVEKHIAANLSKLNKAVFSNKKDKGLRLLVQVPDNELPKILAASPDQFEKLIAPYLSDFSKLEVEGAVFRKQFTRPVAEAILPGSEKGKAKERAVKPNPSVAARFAEEASDLSGRDIPKFVHKLIEQIQSPEDLITHNNTLEDKQRPDNATVLENVRTLNLTGGPSDVPAFYDFHSLQIAFPDVWQELIDQDVIYLTERLLSELAEMGVDVGELSSADDVLTMLGRQVEAVDLAARQIEGFKKPMQRKDGQYAKKNQNGQAGSHNGYANGHPAEAGRKPDGVYVPPAPTPARELLQQLEELLAAPNKFTVFKEGLINYGILVSYRQKWTPLNYQVGDLVRSIPLSPKEVRKVTTKRVVKKDRTVKEMENNLQSRQNESTETGRTESEIVDKAQKNTSFSASASYTSTFGLTASSDFKTDSSKSSDAVKKNFREAVVKAAQEFKDERKLEVETKETYENEFSENTEISNPNDELTVTYLFYELQRRFEVSEQLYKITPVVLVPMPMPNPDKKEITQLILKYCWVINRVLLDDRFRPALDYIMTGLIGDEAAIKEMRSNIASIRNNITDLASLVTDNKQKIIDAKNIFLDEWEDLDESNRKKYIEKNKYQVELSKDAVDQAIQHEQKLMEQMAAEQSNLLKMTQQLNQLTSAYETKLFEINVFRLHIKENIFYYMQAIWDYTHKDQLFMTLYDDLVPVIQARERALTLIGQAAELPPSITPLPAHTALEVEVRFEFEAEPIDPEVSLIQIADLDRPMGYKGNYMIFPMRQPNAITEFMMTPYLDEELGLRDPDGLGHWTAEAFIEYVNHLRATKTKAEFAAIEDALTLQFGRILSASRRLTEEIIVPTDSLFIEALPGKHPLLEDFKLMHRAMDVQKVQAEVRAIELENLRYAARLLNNEHEDPRIEKKIVVEGNGSGHSLNIVDPN